MSKNYQQVETETTAMASEPVSSYNIQNRYQAPQKMFSERERILTNTMSVDEYFDRLINLVHEDYAKL